MSDEHAPDRLDSWKAIADYLQRDVATARRWEALGLPVRRVPGGRGRSVFAYPAEIDVWLKTRTPAPTADAAVRPRSAWKAAVAVTAVVAGLAVWRAVASHATALPLDITVSPAGVVALNASGAERWRYPFDPRYITALPKSFYPPFVLDANRVYVATSHRIRNVDQEPENGELLSLDLEGRLRHTFEFDDEVTFAGTKFGAPWVLTAFAERQSNGQRLLAVAAHHFVWSPSVVTILDEQWNRRGTFTHAGWIEAVRWLGMDRLVIGGFSEGRNGGMIGLLDASALNGQGPEPPGTRYYCDTCGGVTGIRMVVMPRSELNRVTASPFNRASVQIVNGNLVARTIEMAPSESDIIDAVYEFTPALDLVSAKYSDRYWEMHRVLEAQGTLNHTREQCPDKDGPREIQAWTPDAGWRTQSIR